MPGALFFTSFRVFLTSDVKIGGTYVSGLVFFCERCQPWSVGLYGSVQKWAQIFSISFLSVYISFYLFFVLDIFFFDPRLYICLGPLPLWSIISAWSVNFFHDLSASFSHFCSTLHTLLSLSLTYFPSFSSLWSTTLMWYVYKKQRHAQIDHWCFKASQSSRGMKAVVWQ